MADRKPSEEMHVEHTSDAFARFSNGTTWPLAYPRRPNEYDSTSYKLRYRDKDHVFSMEERLHAASIVDAYQSLVEMPLADARCVLKALKAALVKREKDGG